MTAGQIAALIAAVAFALLSCVGVFVLIRLARLISEATVMMSELRHRSDLLIERANTTVDRAREQLARTDAITANMDEVSSNMAELTGDISMLTGTVRALLAGPAGRIAAFTFGVRRAIGLRRADGRDGSRRQLAASGSGQPRRLTASPRGGRRGSRAAAHGEKDQRAALTVGR
jgi:uncharacterized protein YoxC